MSDDTAPKPHDLPPGHLRLTPRGLVLAHVMVKGPILRTDAIEFLASRGNPRDALERAWDELMREGCIETRDDGRGEFVRL